VAVSAGARTAAAASLLLAAAGALAEDAVLHLPIGDPARKEREASVVLDAVTDTESGRLLTPAELPPRLLDARLVLVGEEHTAMAAHAVERRVIEELDRSGRRVSVALEMFPYTQQPVLDDWSAGRLSEDEFLAASRWYKHWGYNWAYYRDIFLYAREHRLRMLAVNAPREVVSAVRKKGFEGLTPEEAAHIPTRIDTKSADHMRLFRASFTDATFHTGMTEEQWQTMLSAQCTWDATMAFQAVAPLVKDADPKAVVVVLAGSGHVQYGLGIERQARQWYAGKIATVVPVPVADDKGEAVRSVQASYANFVWGVPAESEPAYPELGISTRPVDGEAALEVLHVEEDSVGARAGLKAGDRLVALDGASLPDRETLARVMAAKRWGDAVPLEVRREKKTVSILVPLRRSPAPNSLATRP
jgi:uncharacterized iron-regulated protein